MIAWTIYLTLAGGVLVLVLPRAFARWVALFATIAGLALGTIVFVGTPIADLAHFTTIVRVPWVPALGMNYHLALDGVSLTMVLVTGISAVSTVLFSWDVEHRQNEFFFWLLLVVGGCYGVFLSADLFLLFVFYELVIVPKYFLIAIFGSTNKEYGAMKLTLYSFFGGMLVFVGILVAYVGGGSLDLNQLSQFEFSPQLQSWAFPVLFSALLYSPASGRCTPGRRLAMLLPRLRFDVARGNRDEAWLLCRSARRDESFSAGISDVEQMDRRARSDRNRVCRGSGATPT
jgi:NADH-quinone oxidoreductase subunit M